MGSRLIITPVEKLQEKVNNLVKGYEGSIGVYVSLNKTQKSLEESFKSKGINIEKLFFIDCVTNEKTRDDVLHLSPNNLEELLISLDDFLREISGEKFILIDALSTLLIYNAENKVADFIQQLTKKSSEGIEIIAISPQTKGEELLNKIFNFFDKVEKA